MADTTARDLRSRGHSYRGFEPSDITAVVNTDDAQAALGVLEFIEAGRFTPVIEAIDALYDGMTRSDYRQQFSRRNPDLAEWVATFRYANGDEVPAHIQSATENGLPPDRSRATNPPPYIRRDYPDRGMLEDMASRPRGYDFWTPHEFLELVGKERVTITARTADELELGSFGDRVDWDFPIEWDARRIATRLLERVEFGRMEDVARTAHKFFIPLDPDEREMFAQRNPGVMMWLSAYGASQHLIHGDQLFGVRESPMPTLREAPQG